MQRNANEILTIRKKFDYYYKGCVQKSNLYKLFSSSSQCDVSESEHLTGKKILHMLL